MFTELRSVLLSCFLIFTTDPSDLRYDAREEHAQRLAETRENQRYIRISSVWWDKENPISREHLDRHPYYWDRFSGTYRFGTEKTRPNRIALARERNPSRYIRHTRPNRRPDPYPVHTQSPVAVPMASFFSAAGFQNAMNVLNDRFEGNIPTDPADIDPVFGPERPPSGTAAEYQNAYTSSGKLRRRYRRGRVGRYRRRYSYKSRKLFRDAMAMRRMKSRVFNRIYQVYGKPRYGGFRKSYRRRRFFRR